jgi:YHS domain-containing protein
VILVRAVLYLIGLVLAFSAIRSVIGIIVKGFADLVNPEPTPKGPSGPRTRTPRVPASEALKRDPVCGTFLAPSTAVTSTVSGQTYFFCSTACRDKFKK